MKKQSLLIITAVAIPLSILAALSVHLASHKLNTLQAMEAKARNAKGHPANLKEALQHNQNMLSMLEQMTQEQWDLDSEQHHGLPKDVVKARAAVKTRLTALQAMTPEQWLAEKKRRQESHGLPQPTPPATQNAVSPTTPKAAPVTTPKP